MMLLFGGTTSALVLLVVGAMLGIPNAFFDKPLGHKWALRTVF